MKSVLVIFSTDRLSGPGRQILQFIEYMDRTRYRPLLACTWLKGKPYPDFFAEADRREIPIIVLRQAHPFDPRPILEARRAIRENGISIIQTHGYKPSVIGACLKATSGLPWIAFMHGETAENRKIKFYNILNLRLMRRADKVVGVSEALRKWLATNGIPEEKTVTIHNAIDPRDHDDRGNHEELRREFGIADDDKVLAVIGRFSPEKGQRYFLEAFREISSRVPHVKALLVGEGPDEQMLRDFCASSGLAGKVIFAGYQKNVTPFYRAADLIVMPSLSEGLPNVALEALYHGKPLVATRVGGTPEVVTDEETGLLVEARDPAGMAGVIAGMLRDPELMNRLVQNGRKLVMDTFMPQAKAEKLARLYDLILDNDGRRSGR